MSIKGIFHTKINIILCSEKEKSNFCDSVIYEASYSVILLGLFLIYTTIMYILVVFLAKFKFHLRFNRTK